MSKHGTFAWFELVTPDVEAGVAFWSEVGGLRGKATPMGTSTYTMLERDGEAFAGAAPPQMPGVPPHWLAYWAVDDVDARAAKVPAAGGRVIVPPTDIPTVGRFSIVADAHGATFALFKSAQASADSARRPVGWVELWSKDAARAVPFYVEVLGLTAREMAMPTGPYHVLSAGGEDVAGAMTAKDPKIPAMWLPYLTVDDVDAAMGRVRSHGGVVHVDPMTVPGVGRFGVVADRQGAALGLLVSER